MRNYVRNVQLRRRLIAPRRHNVNRSATVTHTSIQVCISPTPNTIPFQHLKLITLLFDNTTPVCPFRFCTLQSTARALPFSVTSGWRGCPKPLVLVLYTEYGGRKRQVIPQPQQELACAHVVSSATASVLHYFLDAALLPKSVISDTDYQYTMLSRIMA